MIAASNLLKKGKAYELENIFLKCKTELIVITHKMGITKNAIKL